VSKVHFESPSGFVVDYRSTDLLYLMIRRCDFDNLLFSLARKNVEIATGLVRKVTVHSDHASVSTDGHEYRARMIIGCDGANSIVARASGLRTGSVQSDYAIDMMEETPQEELSTAERDRMYIYYRIRSHHGYGYVFPKTSHLNVGVGFKLDYYLSNLRGEHYAHHQAFVDDLKSKHLLTGRSNRANFKAFPLPISGPLARTYADRVLLAGDAGGFVNALTAEGIYYAMVTGELAARAAIDAIRAGDFASTQLRGYEPAWKREIGDELANSVRLQKLLLADPARIDRIVRAASRHAVLADLLARFATGALTRAQFKRSMLRRALPVYVREKARSFFHA
jgi:flavin-dependent dehydrogenase